MQKSMLGKEDNKVDEPMTTTSNLYRPIENLTDVYLPDLPKTE